MKLSLFVLLISWSAVAGVSSPDWLIDPTSYKARVAVSPDGRELELSNGLIRRVFRITPNAATVALDNLVTGESLLRGVKPEALVEIDGRRFEVGGLKGQPNYAFLRPEWIDQLRSDPKAFRYLGYQEGVAQERMAWKRTRHTAPDVQWPPAGSTLRLDFAWPSSMALDEAPSSAGRVLSWSDDFAKLDPASSGRWFDGWKRMAHETRADAATVTRPAVARARTWLLTIGWRRHGLLDPADVPG